MAKKAVTKRVLESTVKPYELMLIMSSDLREPEVKKKLKEITDMIEKAGGKITHEDFWGKRNLAYRIGKHSEGYYMVYNTEMLNQSLSELKEHLRIEKDVIRSMILTLPEGHTYTKYDLDAIVEEKKKPSHRPSHRPSYAKRPEDQPVPEKKAKVIEEKKEEEPKKEPARTDTGGEVKKKEAKEDKTDKEKDADLDKKLDEILEGEDLKL